MPKSRMLIITHRLKHIDGLSIRSVGHAFAHLLLEVDERCIDCSMYNAECKPGMFIYLKDFRLLLQHKQAT